MSNTHTDVLLVCRYFEILLVISPTHLTSEQAGATAAFTVDLLVYPLDTLKTRFQSPDYQKIYYDASKNTLNKRVLFRGLYQGVGSVILITIPSCKLVRPISMFTSHATSSWCLLHHI